MKIEDIYMHNFYYFFPNSIERKKDFLNKLKSILTYSIVSYNYYEKYIKDGLYEQRVDEEVKGYSTDYVSITDLEAYEIEKKYHDLVSNNCNKYDDPYDDMQLFIQIGSYILLNRDWIKDYIGKTKDSKNMVVCLNPFIFNFELDSLSCIEYLTDSNIYTLPGEIKILDKIPKDAICGLAFDEKINKYIDNELLEKIEMVKKECHFESLPNYLIEDSKKLIKM